MSDGIKPGCSCKSWAQYRQASLNPSNPYGVLADSLLTKMLPPELSVIAEGSLLNKVFPSKKDYLSQLKLGFVHWARRNGLPTIPHRNAIDLGLHLWEQHTHNITQHITTSSITNLQSQCGGAIFHCEKKHASSLRIFCPRHGHLHLSHSC